MKEDRNSDDDGEDYLDEINRWVEAHQKRHGALPQKLAKKEKKTVRDRDRDLEKGEGEVSVHPLYSIDNIFNRNFLDKLMSGERKE